jgi:magnesium chelatase family protein
MPSKVFSAAVIGLNAQIIEVEVDSAYGLRHFEIVGLPDKSVQEAKERVATAIDSTGFPSPNNQPVKVLVSLAPADLKKEGALYDLPIALGYLLAEKEIKFDPARKVFIGELALDGKLRPARGIISLAIACKEKGIEEIILPKENAAEGGLIKDIRIIGVESLGDAIDYLTGKKIIEPTITGTENLGSAGNVSCDLALISGQESAKRALEIIAAGGHNLLMSGPPGTGKTLLAKALATIMPPLSFEESLEVTKVYSVCGLLSAKSPLVTQRPFRAPHHTSSGVALIGGGNPPKPGEITLAHRGVLFLDEFPEFHRDVLEALRQPIEEGNINLLRARHALTLPARFTLILAANPCPCGNFGNPDKRCVCSSSQIKMYQKKLSGPLMDRVDLFITVPSVKYEKLAGNNDNAQSSQAAKEKVLKARRIQQNRFDNFATNAEMGIIEIKKYCPLDGRSQTLIKNYVDSGKLSARGYHRVLKVARTIADLEESESILFDHLAEALMYRPKGGIG